MDLAEARKQADANAIHEVRSDSELDADTALRHLAQISPWKRRLEAALSDMTEGFKSWRLWWTLGLNDIRQRYRRSKVGQFWITASMAIFIGALSVVYSTLFNMDIRDYAPFFCVNFIIWTFISSTLIESCSAFTQAEGYLKQERLPKTIFPLRLLVRNSIIFAHNAALIPIVFLLAGKGFSWTIIAIIPGAAILLTTCFLMTLFLGMICTRFRDLPQVVANFVQVAFFVTPITWKPEQVAHSAPWIIDWNPFASLLMLIADPINGHLAPLRAYAMGLVLVFGLAALTGFAFTRFRERIVYWL